MGGMMKQLFTGFASTVLLLNALGCSNGNVNAAAPPPPPVVQLEPTTRKDLVWETRFVMVAFLLPAVMGAVLLFVQHVAGVGNITRFPVYIKNPVGNLFVGILNYLPVASTVPLVTVSRQLPVPLRLVL